MALNDRYFVPPGAKPGKIMIQWTSWTSFTGISVKKRPKRPECVCERQHWGENTVKFTGPPLARARPFKHVCSERPWILFRVIEPRPQKKASFGWSLGCNPESLGILGHGYLYWRVARFFGINGPDHSKVSKCLLFTHFYQAIFLHSRWSCLYHHMFWWIERP